MPVIDSRLWVIGLSSALVSGCGSVITNGVDGASNPTVVTLTFPSGTSPVAAQIGNGAFALQTLNGNTLNLSIPSGTSNYAVVYLCPTNVVGPVQSAEEGVWEASTADGSSFNLSCSTMPATTAGTGALTGSLDASAIPGAASYSMAAQNGNAFREQEGYALFFNGPTANIYTLAPAGNDRVLLLVFDSNKEALAAKNFDNQAVPGALNGGNTVVFGAADESTPAAITYNNVPSGYSNLQASVGLRIGGGVAQAPMIGVGGNQVPIAANATSQYPMLPSNVIESGDYYLVGGGAMAPGNASPFVLAETTSSGGAVSLTFPAPWTYAGPAPAAQPAFNFSYAGFSGKTGVLQEAMYIWETGAPGPDLNNYQVEISATANHQGGSTALALPNLSGLTGFLPAPASGTVVYWSAEIWQYSSGINLPLPLNSTRSGVSNQGVFTVP